MLLINKKKNKSIYAFKKEKSYPKCLIVHVISVLITY